jgi:hypothetical protein
MNEQEFAEQIASVVTQYIQGKFEDYQERDEVGKADLNRIRALRDSRNYKLALLEILENPIFELSPTEVPENAKNLDFCDCLYLNISKLYDELKTLSDAD